MKIELTDEELTVAQFAAEKMNANRNPNDPKITAYSWIEDCVNASLDATSKEMREAELAKLRAIGEAIIDAPPEVAKDILTYAQKRLAE